MYSEKTQVGRIAMPQEKSGLWTQLNTMNHKTCDFHFVLNGDVSVYYASCLNLMGKTADLLQSRSQMSL